MATARGGSTPRDADKYRREAQRLQTRFRGILDAAPDAIVVVDPAGRIVLVNSETERLFGYERRALWGQSVEVLVPVRFRDGHPAHRDGYFADPHTRSMGSGLELAGIRKDGTEFPVEISLSPLAVGKARYAMAAIRDVTARKKTEAKFRDLLEAAPDAMIIVNQSGVITLVNSQAVRLFGYSREELLGRPIEMLVPKRVGDVHVGHRTRYFGDPHRRPMGSGLELSGCRKDGTQFPVEISLSPVETEDGMLVTAAVRDLTERLRLEEIRREMADRRVAEQEVRRLNEQLERRVLERTSQFEAANAELEAFTYSVSHDLRAPIRQIDGFSRLLMEKFGTSLEDGAQHYVRRIQEGAQHMGRLVDDLLQLTRIGRKDVRPRVVAMNELVQEVLADLLPEHTGRAIEWNVASLPAIECDPGLLKVALANLIRNAVKYTRPRATAIIEIGHIALKGRAVIFIRDNGVGFDMKYADKLFGVFQRLHRPEEFEGTGVGLATVQRIVHKHGGEVWAEAVVDAGATFYFALTPAVAEMPGVTA